MLAKILKLNDKRTITAWALFDWANSAYALVISVAIFPPYFLSITPDTVQIFGQSISDSVLYTYSFTVAYIAILLVTPLLSGLADYGGYKKRFLRFFTLLGALACISMAYYRAGTPWQFGVAMFMLATIGFAGGLVFYNSYLPLIASPDRYDRISAKGFAYGYVGSVILLVINLVVITNFAWFGFSESAKAVPTAFTMVGLWWIGFSQIPFRRLPDDEKRPFDKKMIGFGWDELKSVGRKVRQSPNVRRFLLGFFFFNAGVQTVLYLAAIFADKELKFDSTELIILVLLLQVLGIAGAVGFARLSERIGNKTTLFIMLFLWLCICVAAFLIQGKTNFYILSAFVGLVMGIQALSRSTYSRLLPEGTKDTATWFSFYDIVDKLAIIVGTFSYGLVEMITGSMRYSSLLLGVFFIIGALFLIRLKVQPASIESSIA